MKSMLMILIALAVLVGGVVVEAVDWDARVSRQENEVAGQFESCTNELNAIRDAIVMAAEVDENFQGNMVELASVLLSNEPTDAEIVSALGVDVDALSFNTETDLSATALEVQREIRAGRVDFVACWANAIQSRVDYANLMEGMYREFWAGIFGHPEPLPMSHPLRPVNDLDGDGIITVKDFPPLVGDALAISVRQGQSPEPLDLYPDD